MSVIYEQITRSVTLESYLYNIAQCVVSLFFMTSKLFGVDLSKIKTHFSNILVKNVENAVAMQ